MICPTCHRAVAGARTCPYDGATLSPKRRVDLVPRAPSPRDGERLGGRYVVHGLLGEGTMAKIFLGEDERTGEAVAIKVLDREKARTRNIEQLFMEEAAITERVSHPGIAASFDVGEHHDGSVYLVMELLIGETLGERILRLGVPSVRESAWLVRDVAHALAAAHEADVIHRDVKPDNIFLVGKLGAPHAAKVLDFGLAHSRSASVPDTESYAVGTVEYMAPEQALGEVVDGRSDIYGLGVVLFRLLTARLPFLGNDKVDILAQQVATAAPAPSLLRPGLHPDLDRLVLRALSKDPASRYQTMVDFADDLDRFLAGGRTTASPPRDALDRYQPRTAFGEQTARFFHRRLELPYLMPGPVAAATDPPRRA